MSSYGDMDYFMSLDFDDAIELIRVALEKKRKQESWEMWLTMYPGMDSKSFVPFDKFYEDLNKPIKVSERSETKIVDKEKYVIDTIAMAEQIKKAHQKQFKAKN